MKRKIVTTVTLLSMMMISGCGGPSPSEIGEIALMTSIGILILSIPIIILLGWLAGLCLVRSKIVWAQFVGLAIISIGLFFHYGSGWGSDGLRLITAIGIMSIPYLLLVASLEILCLPACVCRFLPILVIIPHFVASILLVLTDSESLLQVFPLMLPLTFWPLTIIILLFTIGCLIVQKLKRKKQEDKDKNIN